VVRVRGELECAVAEVPAQGAQGRGVGRRARGAEPRREGRQRVGLLRMAAPLELELARQGLADQLLGARGRAARELELGLPPQHLGRALVAVQLGRQRDRAAQARGGLLEPAGALQQRGVAVQAADRAWVVRRMELEDREGALAEPHALADGGLHARQPVQGVGDLGVVLAMDALEHGQRFREHAARALRAGRVELPLHQQRLGETAAAPGHEPIAIPEPAAPDGERLLAHRDRLGPVLAREHAAEQVERAREVELAPRP
jgi:hypothetical protein